jgi:hypothetical protein
MDAAPNRQRTALTGSETLELPEHDGLADFVTTVVVEWAGFVEGSYAAHSIVVAEEYAEGEGAVGRSDAREARMVVSCLVLAAVVFRRFVGLAIATLAGVQKCGHWRQFLNGRPLVAAWAALLKPVQTTPVWQSLRRNQACVPCLEENVCEVARNLKDPRIVH